MQTVLYVALMTGDPSRGYRAMFPDLADCSAEGRDLGELLGAARQQLTASLEALSSRGEAWPAATPLEAIARPADTVAIPIDVSVDDPPVRVNISLGERLLHRVDAAAEARGMSRSGFIAQSLRISLGERGPAREEFAAGYRKVEDELSSMGRRINEALGPESAFSRRMADLDDKLLDGVRRAAEGVSAAMVRRQQATRGARADETSHADVSGAPSLPEEANS